MTKRNSGRQKISSRSISIILKLKKAGEEKVFDEISGRISDSKGDPLSGVSITVKGTTKGTATNTRGEFSIDANKGDVLVVSYVGYEKKKLQ